jgi:two-component system OmpR family response regulator
MFPSVLQEQVTSLLVSPLTVVVATRDPAIGRMIAMALRLEGYQPRLYADSDQALKALRSSPAVAAVLDLHLPDSGGVSLFRRVRSGTFSSSVPIILLMMQEDGALLRAWKPGDGVSAVLCLPFELRELLAAVTAAVPSTRRYA